MEWCLLLHCSCHSLWYLCQVSLFQFVHNEMLITPPCFPFVTGSGTLLGSLPTSWAVSSPFLSYMFPRPPPQLWFWFCSASLFPCWSYVLMALKTSSTFMILKFVFPAHFLSWKERVRMESGLHSLSVRGSPEGTQGTPKYHVGPPVHFTN